MEDKQKKPFIIRLFRAISSLVLIGATTFIVIAGFSFVSTLLLISSLGGVAIPAVMSAEGALDAVTGVFEVFFEGVLSFFEIIGDIFGSIFG